MLKHKARERFLHPFSYFLVNSRQTQHQKQSTKHGSTAQQASACNVGKDADIHPRLVRALGLPRIAAGLLGQSLLRSKKSLSLAYGRMQACLTCFAWDPLGRSDLIL